MDTNQFNDNYIHNNVLGWRERTWSEKTSKKLDNTLGPSLEYIGSFNWVIPALFYGALAGGVVTVAVPVFFHFYDAVDRKVSFNG